MAGGVFLRFARGRAGTAGAHMRYITRPSATDRDEDALQTRNLPDWATEGRSYGEVREGLIEYARQREEDELTRPRPGGGETRTHYRLVISFEERVSSERAHDLVRDYLDAHLPMARTVSVVHQDTEHTHAHVYIDARDTTDHKLHFGERDYRRLDERWAEVYARAFGPERFEDHLAKKEETRAWREEAGRARADGQPAPAEPERAERVLDRDDYRAREERNYGADEGRVGRDQPGPAGRDPDAASRGRPAAGRKHDLEHEERAVAGAHQAAGGVEHAYAAAVREAQGLRDELARLRERDEIERSR